MTFKKMTKALVLKNIPVHKAKKEARIAKEFFIPFESSSDIKTWNNNQKYIFFNIISRISFDDRYWYNIKIPRLEFITKLDISNDKLLEEVSYMKEHCYIEDIIDPLFGFKMDDNLIENIAYNDKYIAFQINPIYRMFFDEAGNL